MASFKYRCLTPNVKVEQHLCKADEKFFHESSSFVYLDSTGLVRVCLTSASAIYGWAIVPQGMGADTDASYWKANSSGTSKIQVIVSRKARYLAIVDAVITRANIGNALDFKLPAANGAVQTFALTTPGEDVARIVGLATSLKGGTTTDAIIKIFTWQADT